MEIRELQKEERIATRSLYEEIFPEDSRGFVDYYYTEKIKDNHIYVAEDINGMQAMLHLNPYTLLVNGEEKPASYIVAVATKKESRRRGYMAALLKRALADMYDREEPFTFLMPAAEGIYLPHGFRTVYEQEIRYCNPEEIKLEKGLRRGVPKDCQEIAELAKRHLKENYQVYAKRDESYYLRLMKEYESDGGFLAVKEKDGLICDCRPCVEDGGEEKPKIMIRIVHLEEMLKLLGVKGSIEVCFQVTDPLIPRNSKFIVLKGTENSGINLYEGKPEKREGIISIDVLGEIIFGKKTLKEAAITDGVEMSGLLKTELGKILPLRKIFLNEIV